MEGKVMEALAFVITALIAVIYYLKDHISDLTRQVGTLKSEKELGESVMKLNEAKEAADAEESKFDSMYSAYKSQPSDGSGQK